MAGWSGGQVAGTEDRALVDVFVICTYYISALSSSCLEPSYFDICLIGV